jgi:hypothetical protein
MILYIKGSKIIRRNLHLWITIIIYHLSEALYMQNALKREDVGIQLVTFFFAFPKVAPYLATSSKENTKKKEK